MNYFRLKWTLQVSVRSGLETREVKHWFRQNDKKETFPRKFVLIKMRFLDISSSSKIIFFFNYFLIASALGNFSVVCAKICKFRANYWTMSRFRSLSRSQFKRCVNSLPKPCQTAKKRFCDIFRSNFPLAVDYSYFCNKGTEKNLELDFMRF